MKPTLDDLAARPRTRALLASACCAAACSAPELPDQAPAPRSAIRVASADASCQAPATPIHSVQGSGGASPLAGEEVLVEGIVTAPLQGPERLGGFFLQAEGADDDPRTSEGLFVFEGESAGRVVHAGERVRVRGRVGEHFGLTQLADVVAISVCGAGEVVPARLASSGLTLDGLEAFEGMLVALPALTLIDSYRLQQWGELTLSASGRLFAAAGGESAGAPRLILDDGISQGNTWPSPLLSGEEPPRVGSTLAEVTGVLTYAFGDYRLVPTEPLVWRAAARPAAPRARGNLAVASLNLDNYFLTLASRGAQDEAERERQRAKLVSTLAALDADIFALTELENDGTAAGEALLGALNARGGGYRLATGVSAGNDALRSAFFYRASRVQALGPATFDGAAVFKRPPLLQTFAVGGFRLQVVAVHLKSKRCSDGASSADETTGCSSDERLAEARALSALMQRLLGESNDGTLLLGDFNSYAFEAPVEELAKAGVLPLLAGIAESERYSYVFQGQSGLLDHAFADARLAERLRSAAIWHVNADESALFSYRETNPPHLFAPDAFRSSDHDPLLLGFDVP